MATTQAHVTPEVLRWARESLGYSREQAAARIGVREDKLARAEAGEELLTLRQAERAADTYERPLAALFLSEPPDEEPQEAQFRRLPGAPAPPWPPEMQALARRVRRRQEAADDLYDLLEEIPPWEETSSRLQTHEPAGLAQVARAALGISLDEQMSWRDHAGYTPLRRWIDAAEELGVLVMQDGTMPVDTMRGFASVHPAVPALVVNTQDDARARSFTLVHELGHLLLEANGVPVGPSTEPWCDEFAGNVLMPADPLTRAFRSIRDRDDLGTIDELALIFGVTPHAAAVRSARAGLLPQPRATQVIRQIQERGGPRQAGGGNYYRTQIGRLGPSFIRLVFSALDGQAVTYPAALSLLNVKASNFEKLRDYVDQRAEVG